MKVGLTYDLRDYYLAKGYSEEQTAEFDSAETIAAIETTLQELGFQTERIGNIFQLTQALVDGKVWDVVFNIAEGMHGISREAQVPALLDAYQIPYIFSDAVTLALTHEKSLAKKIVRDHGIPTAPFMLVKALEDISNCELAFPLFAKPVAEGTGKGVTPASLLTNEKDFRTVCPALLQKYQQAVLIEEFLPGREFTVGIIGTGTTSYVLGVVEIILRETAEQQVYSFTNKEFCEEKVEYRLVHDAEAKQAAENALKAWIALGCRDAGRVDLRSNSQNIPQFLEVNPLAGLHPTHSDLPILATLVGCSYKELLHRIMSAALNRLQICNSSHKFKEITDILNACNNRNKFSLNELPVSQP